MLSSVPRLDRAEARQQRRQYWQRQVDALMRAEGEDLTWLTSDMGRPRATILRAACEVAVQTLLRLDDDGWLARDGGRDPIARCRLADPTPPSAWRRIR
jgi:hypothetical protein